MSKDNKLPTDKQMIKHLNQDAPLQQCDNALLNSIDDIDLESLAYLDLDLSSLELFEVDLDLIPDLDLSELLSNLGDDNDR